MNRTTDANFSTANLTNGVRYSLSSYYIIPSDVVSLYKNICYLGVVPAMFIVGLVLNSLCCAMFCKMKKKSSSVVLLLGLAIADIHSILNAGVVAAMYSSQTYGIPFSSEQQLLSTPLFAAFISTIPARTVNVLTLFISVERMLCVLMPMKIRQISTWKTSVGAIFISYIVSVLCSLPFAFFYAADKMYSNATRSYVTILKTTELGKNVDIADGLYISMEALVRFVPFGGIVISSTVTSIVVIITSRRRLKIAEVNLNSKAFGHERQVTKTLLTITFIYIVCQLPTNTLRMIMFLDPENSPYRYKNNIFEVAQVASFIILLTNSVVNFFIYINTSSNYRERFKQMCGGARRKMRSSVTLTTNTAVLQ